VAGCFRGLSKRRWVTRAPLLHIKTLSQYFPVVVTSGHRWAARTSCKMAPAAFTLKEHELSRGLQASPRGSRRSWTEGVTSSAQNHSPGSETEEEAQTEVSESEEVFGRQGIIQTKTPEENELLPAHWSRGPADWGPSEELPAMPLSESCSRRELATGF
ncbi:hypothetical protein KUCAC02_007350, partial [Chaenocephalus aceratus]